MKNNKKCGFGSHVRERLHDKGFVAVSSLYLAFCLFSAIWWSVHFIPGHIFMSVAFMFFIPAMLLVEYLLSMRFGPAFMAAALSIAVGGILGSPFSMYSTVPIFDDILHTISGFVFAALGFALAVFFFGEVNCGRKFAGVLIFGIAFSLGIAVLWELWEFGGMMLFEMETADDTIIHSFKSFIFYGRSEPVVIDDILKTVIYYGSGESFVVDGYLDIGYMDTVLDMIVCTVGALAFSLVALVGYLKLPGVNKALIPQVISRKSDPESTVSLDDTPLTESDAPSASPDGSEIACVAHEAQNEEVNI